MISHTLIQPCESVNRIDGAGRRCRSSRRRRALAGHHLCLYIVAQFCLRNCLLNPGGAAGQSCESWMDGPTLSRQCPGSRKLASTWNSYSLQVPSTHARDTASQRSSRARPFKQRWASCSSPGSSVFSNCVVIVRSLSIVLVASSIPLDAASVHE